MRVAFWAVFSGLDPHQAGCRAGARGSKTSLVLPAGGKPGSEIGGPLEIKQCICQGFQVGQGQGLETGLLIGG